MLSTGKPHSSRAAIRPFHRKSELMQYRQFHECLPFTLKTAVVGVMANSNSPEVAFTRAEYHRHHHLPARNSRESMASCVAPILRDAPIPSTSDISMGGLEGRQFQRFVVLEEQVRQLVRAAAASGASS